MKKKVENGKDNEQEILPKKKEKYIPPTLMKLDTCHTETGEGGGTDTRLTGDAQNS